MFGKILIANRGDRANGAAAQANFGAAEVKARSAGRSHRPFGAAAQANFGAAEVKARSAGRSQFAGDHAAGH
jgi:hypothetical protein